MLQLNTFKLINLINLFTTAHKEQGRAFLSPCLMCTMGNVSGKQNKCMTQSLACLGSANCQEGLPYVELESEIFICCFSERNEAAFLPSHKRWWDAELVPVITCLM